MISAILSHSVKVWARVVDMMLLGMYRQSQAARLLVFRSPTRAVGFSSMSPFFLAPRLVRVRLGISLP